MSVAPASAGAAAATRPKTGLRDALRRMAVPLLFMSPALVLTVIFFFAPVIILLGISMTNMSTATGLANYQTIGLANYSLILRHPSTPTNLWATVRYVLFTLTLFNVGAALVIALLSTHVPRRAGFAFRALWLLPRLTPSVVYIMMWKFIGADAPYGIINRYLLGPLGVPSANLTTTEPFLFVVLTNGFLGASFGMIVFTSAIESIPKDYMMAALVDGCTAWQRIRYVILPMIRWPLLFVTTYQTLSLLTSYEQILLLTDGAGGTEVWALWSYHRALNNYWGNFQWGFGAALAMLLVVIGIVMSFIYMRFFRFGDLIQEPRIEAL
jgi:inositol-phosphate transport system permease protein